MSEFVEISLEPYELYVVNPLAQEILHPAVHLTGTMLGADCERGAKKFTHLTEMPPEKTFYSLSVVQPVEAEVTLMQVPVLLAVRRKDRRVMDEDLPAAMVGLAIQQGIMQKNSPNYRERIVNLFELMWPRGKQQLNKRTEHLTKMELFAMIHNEKVQRNAFGGKTWHCQLMRYASMVNHSCAPNSRTTQDELMMEMRFITIRALLNQEEVTIAYVHWPIDCRESRQMLLRMQGFECMCVCCQKDVPPSLFQAWFGVELTKKTHCWWCGAIRAPHKCPRCRKAHYCNAACQKANWPVHKQICVGLRSSAKQPALKTPMEVPSEQLSLGLRTGYDPEQ